MIGIGVNIIPFISKAARAVGDYIIRVTSNGGVSESTQCVNTTLSQLDSQDLLDSASLVMIPSGYKEDVVYSQIPTDGSGDLSFTRASNGTRINSAGLVEVCPWNLVENSENFSANFSAINSSVSNNTTTAPNGTTTADSLLETTDVEVHAITTDYTESSGQAYTFSVYVKSISGRNVRVSGSTGFAGPIALVDLSNGSLLSGSSGASVEGVGNGWYRISITTTTTTTQVRVLIYSMNGTATTFAGSTSNGVYLWGAQLNIGSTAKPYFPTTDRLNVPRLSYMYGSCPALLLEPQRTNLLPNQLSYNTATGVAYSTSVTDSPVIGLNSTRITKNEASGTLRYGNQICSSSALAGSTTYTISAYFKYDGYAVTTTMEYNNSLQWGGTSWNQIINIASTGVTLGSSSSCTGSVQNVGNGWYRVSVTITTGASISGGTPVSYLMQVASTLSTGQGFLQAAPQFEQGAYSTTTIITSGASATRIADSFSRNNIYTNGLITSSGGTWFVELRGNEDLIRSASAGGIFINTGTMSLDGNGFLLRNPTSASQKISIVKYISGTPTTLFNSTTSTLKVAIKWNGSTADIFVNGTKEVSATTFTTTAMENLISEATNRTLFIQAMGLHPTPLTDAQCIELTTL